MARMTRMGSSEREVQVPELMADCVVPDSSYLPSASPHIAILCAPAIGEALRADPALGPLTASANRSVLVGLMLIAEYAPERSWPTLAVAMGTLAVITFARRTSSRKP
jgi:hypothetical protein